MDSYQDEDFGGRQRIDGDEGRFAGEAPAADRDPRAGRMRSGERPRRRAGFRGVDHDQELVADPRQLARDHDLAAGELIAWSRILDTDEAVVIVNPNGEGARGGQVVVGGELNRVGDEFLVVANTAEAGAAAGTFTGPHPAGSRIAVRGRRFAGEPTFIAIDPLPPAEVLVLVRIHS